MRDFIISMRKSDLPLYLRIATGIRDAIKSGLVMPGELIPSCRALAIQVNANRHTVMTALDQLVAEGWLHSEARKGYRVAQELPTKFFSPRKSSARSSTLTNPRKALAKQDFSIKWDFRSGTPDLRLFPYDELKTCLNASLKRNAPSLLSYGEPNGHEPFIRELQKYLRRVRGLIGREVIVTHGSQEAIYVAANVLLRHGDEVAIESLTYPAAKAALSATGAILHSLPVDSNGLDTEAFAALCNRRKIKLLYLTPLHHYPTTVTLSSPRRLALYEIAAKHGVLILEDDYDHEYHYRCQPLVPIAAEDPANIVIYVSTLSKVLFPSARLGFAVIPIAFAKAFTDYRKMVTTQNDTLIQDAVARWMRTEGFQRHLNRTRRAYDKRLQSAVTALERHRSFGVPLDWKVPDGGMAIWLSTPWDTEELAVAVRSEGLVIQPEGPTRMDNKPGNHLRLGFARHSADEMASGLKKLFDIGNKLPVKFALN